MGGGDVKSRRRMPFVASPAAPLVSLPPLLSLRWRAQETSVSLARGREHCLQARRALWRKRKRQKDRTEQASVVKLAHFSLRKKNESESFSLLLARLFSFYFFSLFPYLNALSASLSSLSTR